MSSPDGTSTKSPYQPQRPPLSARWREIAGIFASNPPAAGPGPGHDVRLATAAGPVLVIPGIVRGDGQTRSVRGFLDRHGYRSFGWGLGMDVGPTRRLMDGAAARLAELHRDYGPVNLVGLSMGGLFCRWLAHHAPASVRQVVTVGTPFRAPIDSFFLPLRPLLPLWRGADLDALAARVAQTLPVPGTFLYTVTDGTVAWRSCLDPRQPEDCFEVTGAHMTLLDNSGVRSILLQRLSRVFEQRAVELRGSAPPPGRG